MEDCEAPSQGQAHAGHSALQFPKQAGSLLSVTRSESSEPTRPPMSSGHSLALPLLGQASSLPQNSRASRLLPTGQRLHVMNEAEFDELRRKLRMQTASRRYRKRKKEEARKKKMKIQELKAELARLQDLETQLKQYEQRSVESLEEELARNKQEVADLSVKVEEAAKEELDWINTMKAHIT